MNEQPEASSEKFYRVHNMLLTRKVSPSMRILNLFFCFLLLLTLCCSDSTGPGDTGDGEIVGHVTIGSDGGSVESDEVTITVPAGAFEDDASVALTTAPEQSFEDDAVSETYVVAGLPQSYNEEITISIAYNGELTENSYIAVGADTWVTSLGQSVTTYTLLPATPDGDRLTATLPATGFVAAKAVMANGEESTSITVTAVTGYKPHVTAGGYFKIDYASRWTTLESVQKLGEYLEDAYATIAGLGFSYAGRTNWPVSVTVKNLNSSDVYGYSANSLWGDNYGYLEFNSTKMDDLNEMRITAGHEFFHLVQALYDPRNFYSKAKLSSPYLWLDEACSVWIEEKFTVEQGYVSPTRAGNTLAPFEGVVTGASADTQKHGYGLSAMIKYLVGEYGEACLVDIYNAVKDGSDPMTAVRRGTTEPVEWWEEFLRKYALGDIYGAGIAELTANKSGMYRIITNSDTLETFSGDYPDLSGRLYIIRLENTVFDDNAELSLTLEGGMGELSVFKYRLKPSEIEFLGTGDETVSFDDLKSLNAGGWHLIALVSNSRNIDPYTEKTTIGLTIRVSTPINPGFTYFTLHPELYGDFERQYAGQDIETFSTLFYPSYSPAGPGKLEGTTFTGERNEPWGAKSTIVGNFTITFDASFQNILSIEATQSVTTPGDGDSGMSYQNVTFKARNIPLYNIDGSDYNYRLLGDEITDQVASMTFEYGIEGDRWIKLVNYQGSPGSDISIWLRKQ